MAKKMGRPSVFRNKAGGAKVGGLVTKAGSAKFERARRDLAELAPWVKNPSDADVIEYLARGKADTEAYIAANGRRA